MFSFTDQLNRTIFLNDFPKRIVSLVPSQTELLYHLGLDEEVTGITTFCIHPEKWWRSKTRVGGTKNIHIEIIHRLQPQLIIANKEENDRSQVDELAKHYPVWVSNVITLEDAYKMITGIGAVTGKSKNAETLIASIKKKFAELQTINYKLQTAYLIWRNPYMTAGGDTFINTMLQAAGFINVFADSTRYPETTVEELQIMQPDLLLLSSEPYPFKQKHADELQQLLPHTKIILADGEMFSWYGSRLLKAPAYFKQLHQLIG